MKLFRLLSIGAIKLILLFISLSVLCIMVERTVHHRGQSCVSLQTHVGTDGGHPNH